MSVCLPMADRLTGLDLPCATTIMPVLRMFGRLSAASLASSARCNAAAGRDPKPFPPPMKLCKEMVDAMGGGDSSHYRHFRTICCEAYNILRKSSGLILSLFHLMAGASITDMRADPEKAMLKLQVGLVVVVF
jgi:Phosphatidylinositol 3- and 4-kinase